MSTNNIKNLREKMHLSQQYVANYLNIPLDSYIKIENGIRTISLLELSKLLILFGKDAPLFYIKDEN